MEETIRYVNDRRQFNKRIIDFQNTQFQLAKLASDLIASRLLVREAARFYDRAIENEENSELAPSLNAAAKLVATDKCYQIIDGCLQLFGGYGYLKDYPIEQLLRDTRVHRILEGTNEVMQLIISRKFIRK